MAITPIQPVQRRETQRQTRRGGGKTGQIVGAVGGAAIGALGAMTAGPAGAAAGAKAGAGFGAIAGGALSGAATGAGLGGIAGEAIQPARFKTETQALPTGGVPNIRLSQQGQEIAESLKILQQLPPEIRQPHSRSLTAALMQDMAQQAGVA